jgi:beta-lactamase class D
MRLPATFVLAALFLAGAPYPPRPMTGATIARATCFLLYEGGVGEVGRDPSTACDARVTPASTFKVPHALAALDAGVVAGADTTFKYDGAALSFESWRRDHTLASAMRHSVVWYFQRIAELLGPERERDYLRRFDYGNAPDVRRNVTTFWLDGTLAISPREELRFIRRLYANELPVSRAAMDVVRSILIQPEGKVVNASGEHPFAGPWPPGTQLSAKTGSGSVGERTARWIVGHVARGPRSWIFVSCVTGGSDLPALAAVDQAASALQTARVLR